VGNPVTRRVGTVAIVGIIGCLLVAGLVAIAIRTSVPDAILVGLVSGVLASAATAVATLLAVRWTMEGQRSIDRESREFERHVALLTQRAADLRELGVTLTDMVTAAQEIIWERVATGRPMQESDARAMRLTSFVQRMKFLRVVVGDEPLLKLVGETSGAANQLSNSDAAHMRADMASANQALTAALEKVASLIREVETS
jgi:hypothetical protein